MKETEWFPTTINPVHQGHYQVHYDGCTVDEQDRCYWNGIFWTLSSGSEHKCAFGNDKNYNDYWRGLKEPS